MPLIKNFKNFENKIEKEFLKNGFIIQKCENFEVLKFLGRIYLNGYFMKPY